MSRAKKWGRVALITLGLGLLGTALWIFSLLSERDSRLPKLALTLPDEQARARAAGLPSRFDQLLQRPVLKDSDNAALLYREATVLLPKLSADQLRLIQRTLSLNSKLKDNEIEELIALLRKAMPALKLLRQGTERPHCDFGWRGNLTEDEWKQRREELLACDQLGRLLHVLARLGDDPSHSLELLKKHQRLAKHLTEEPGLLVWTIYSAQANTSINSLFLIALQHPDHLLEAQQLAQQWEPAPGVLKQTWQLQCVKEQNDAQRSRTKPYKPENEPFLDYNPLWRELDRLDHRLGWKLYADASEVINLRYWQAVKTALQPLPDTDLRAQWVALKALDAKEDTRGKTFAGYWYPQRYSALASGFLSTQWNANTLLTALAIRDFEVKHGKRPQQLSELPPGTPILDPFSGKPLLWKDPLLYSVGPDEKDNGGDDRLDLVREIDNLRAATALGRLRRGNRRPGKLTGQAE
jgi:hypothetical protein